MDTVIYTNLSYRFYVFIIYFVMGSLYLLHTLIDTGSGQVGNWLKKNHNLLYYLIGIGYFSLSMLYLFNQDVYKMTTDESNKNKNIKYGISLFIAILIIYVGLKLYPSLK